MPATKKNKLALQSRECGQGKVKEEAYSESRLAEQKVIDALAAEVSAIRTGAVVVCAAEQRSRLIHRDGKVR